MSRAEGLSHGQRDYERVVEGEVVKWFYTGGGDRKYVGIDMSRELEARFQRKQKGGNAPEEIRPGAKPNDRAEGTIVYNGETYERYSGQWHRIEEGDHPLPVDEQELARYLERAWEGRARAQDPIFIQDTR